MKCLAVVMFSLWALGATVGSARQSSLDHLVQGQLSALVPLGDAETPLLATKIAKAGGIALGFEEGARLPHPTGSRQPRALSGMTVRDAFDVLTTLDPRYRWQEIDGVAVFRPVAAWSSADDVLNRHVSDVHWNNITAREAADSLTQLLFHTSVRVGQGAGKTFSVNLSDGSVIDLLNQTVTAHGQLMWTVQSSTITRERLLTLKSFDGVGVVATWPAQ